MVRNQRYVEEEGKPASRQQEDYRKAQMEEVFWKDQLKRVERMRKKMESN